MIVYAPYSPTIGWSADELVNCLLMWNYQHIARSAENSEQSLRISRPSNYFPHYRGCPFQIRRVS